MVDPPVEGPRRRRTTHLPVSRTGARLVEIVGDSLGASHPVRDELVLGRQPDVGVAIDSPGISRRHARIERIDEGKFVIEDLGSRNGTLVNGVPVEVRTPLALGDRIQLGANVVFLFTRDDPVDRHLAHLRRMEVVGRMTASVVHDFNNLLSVMLASLEHLSSLPLDEAAPDDEVGASLEDALTAAEDAARLTRRLLAVARPAGTHRDRVDVQSVVEDVVRLCERVFEDDIRILATVSKGLSVRFDATSLSQALMNLCVNARDAMPEGGSLRIAAEAFDATRHQPPIPIPGDYAVITVADDGLGMSEEVRERIFDPFFTTKEEGRGSGLGLATTYSAVRRVGGHITVDSTPGRGTTFTLYLPRGERRPQPVTENVGELMGRVLEGGQLRPVNLLVVAEEGLAQRTMLRLIGRTEHRAVSAVGVEEACAALEAGIEIDLVLVDPDGTRTLPEETIARLAASRRDCAVLVLAAYLSPAEEVAVREAGAALIAKKPISAHDLGHAIFAAVAGA